MAKFSLVIEDIKLNDSMEPTSIGKISVDAEVKTMYDMAEAHPDLMEHIVKEQKSQRKWVTRGLMWLTARFSPTISRFERALTEEIPLKKVFCVHCGGKHISADCPNVP